MCQFGLIHFLARIYRWLVKALEWIKDLAQDLDFSGKLSDYLVKWKISQIS